MFNSHASAFCTVMGIAFLWDTRHKTKVIVPDTIPEAMLTDTPANTTTTA